jgi:hypothetical protein
MLRLCKSCGVLSVLRVRQHLERGQIVDIKKPAIDSGLFCAYKLLIYKLKMVGLPRLELGTCRL